MSERVIFGALLGATIGFGVGYLGARTGGTCPFMCNPYIAAGLGLVLGVLFASSGQSDVRDFTPSSHLHKVESVNQFDEHILATDMPVLVEFGQPGCTHCRRLEPTMHELAEEYKDRATIAIVDTTETPSIAQQYDISAVPTLILIQDGEEVEKMVGYREKKKLRSLLDSHIQSQR